MKLILDTNSLFSFFWKGSLIKKLLAAEHEVFAPEFALEELDKHKSEIMRKAKLSLSEFNELFIDIEELVTFIPFSEYADKIPEAFNCLPEHPKDIDFIALALKEDSAIVSNDKELQKQSRIDVFNKSRFSELF